MIVDYITIKDNISSSQLGKVDNLMVYLGGCCDDSNWKSVLKDSLFDNCQSIEKGTITLIDPWYDSEDCDTLKNVEFNENIKMNCDLLIFNLCCDEICPLTMFEIGVWAKHYNILVLINNESPIYNEIKIYQKLYGFDVFDTDDPIIIKQYILNKFLKKVPQKLGLDSYMKCCDPCVGVPCDTCCQNY